MEAQRFMQPHLASSLKFRCSRNFFAAGVAMNTEWHVVGFGQTVDGTEQVEKNFSRCRCSPPDGPRAGYSAPFQAQPLQHIAGFDLGKIGTQDLRPWGCPSP